MSQSAITADPFLTATLWGCSECLRWATDSAWNGAWAAELRRREQDPAYADPEEWGEHRGLDDRMVCPRCKYVHSDDECSYVDEKLVALLAPTEPPDDASTQ